MRQRRQDSAALKGEWPVGPPARGLWWLEELTCVEHHVSGAVCLQGDLEWSSPADPVRLD